VGPNNSIRVATTLYHIIPATTKPAKNIITILVDKTISTLGWNKPDNILKITVAMVRSYPSQNKGIETLDSPWELRVAFFRSIHRDLIPIYRDQINLLCGMFQIQNKELPKEINEF